MVALAFDFTNGFHDTANAMATSIATGALKPRVAVAISAVGNLAGAFISIKVAATIATGIVDTKAITLTLVFAALIGAIAWNLITWALSLPSSSSHALIGGIVGATLAALGSGAVKGHGLVTKVIMPALFSPLIAGLVAVVGTFVAYKLVAAMRSGQARRGYRLGQIGSASLVSLAHGTNDAQKTMGVITLALIAHGDLSSQHFSVPLWVKLGCGLAIALGTYIGGWRIINTMGNRLTEIEAPQGFAAESSGASVILASSYFGYPLSTTHVVSGAVIGSGLGKRLASVRWGKAGQMAGAWILTIPGAALIGAGAWKGADLIGAADAGPVVIALLAAALAGALYVVTQRTPVHAADLDRTDSSTTRAERLPQDAPAGAAA
ncbi:MAG TPA: inorganic phosphate transporter [Solirubrobacteraceae bacterium]|nr:inorganic phosphate transporter [Solirubrobacteraceae bacterium]